uniref:DUF4408 domain-containing protein n=1 Tax=Macrostomum lignano TaxID=282301 RepID=A0A1I8GK47_9PLAT
MLHLIANIFVLSCYFEHSSENEHTKVPSRLMRLLFLNMFACARLQCRKCYQVRNHSATAAVRNAESNESELNVVSPRRPATPSQPQAEQTPRCRDNDPRKEWIPIAVRRRPLLLRCLLQPEAGADADAVNPGDHELADQLRHVE